MLLKIKNIGKISNANIEIKGITVIAGENDTGKSTVGKVLFCIFNSFFKITNQMYEERLDTIDDLMRKLYRNATNRLTQKLDTIEIAQNIIRNGNEFLSDQRVLSGYIKEAFLEGDENFERHADDLAFSNLAERIIQVLKISDEDILKTVLQKKLESEFNGQISNVYLTDELGEIALQIKDTSIEIVINNNEVKQITNNISLNTEVIYMDDPFALDDLIGYPLYWPSTNYVTHRNHLQRKLRLENNESSIKNALTEIIATKKIDLILDKIETVCNGEIIRQKRSMFGYKKSNSDAILDVRNISTGLKTFVILKTLLMNGSLEDNGTIVLDEPEIHLHPEWQLIFAELIVLIQKEFGMHILLNTHSPYFLNAIEVYTAKYELADRCKYYLAENNQDGRASIVDVSDNIDKIYVKLASPLQTLENERFANDY